MQVLHGLESLIHLPAASAFTVGNFDGVHLGHAQILAALREQQCPANVVATFEPHPLNVLRPDLAPPRLTTTGRKRDLLAEAGVTHLVELNPAAGVLALEARDFFDTIRRDARPAVWAEGPDFRFGRNAVGDVASLAAWAEGFDTRVFVVAPAEATLPGLHRTTASSSLARWLLAHGRVFDAAAVLGRPHEVAGTVVEGHRRGRVIGFPTANVDAAGAFLPADGVYAATATLPDGTTRDAAVSVGTNPTFGGTTRTVEAYLLDFDGDLYGLTLTLALRRWVRGTTRFNGVEALVAQLRRDVAEVRHLAAVA